MMVEDEVAQKLEAAGLWRRLDVMQSCKTDAERNWSHLILIINWILRTLRGQQAKRWWRWDSVIRNGVLN